MVIPGVFAVMGLLLLALHLARPELLRRLVQFDTQLWWFLPWVTADVLDPDGTYQRRHRLVALVALVAWTVVNLVSFLLRYVG